MFRRENFSLLTAVSAVLIPLLLVGVSLARDGRSFYSDHDRDDDAFMGVVLEEETDYPEGGARITQVVDDSPADEAGLKKGDIVVGFDGKTVRGPLSLSNKIDDLEPGDQVEVTIVRDGREQTVDLELGEHAGYSVFSWNDDGPTILGKVFDCADDDDDCSFSFNCSGENCDLMKM